MSSGKRMREAPAESREKDDEDDGLGGRKESPTHIQGWPSDANGQFLHNP